MYTTHLLVAAKVSERLEAWGLLEDPRTPGERSPWRSPGPTPATSSAVPSCGGGKEGGTVERHRSMMVQTNIQSCSGGKKGSCATHSPRLPGQTAVKRRGSAWKEGRAGA